MGLNLEVCGEGEATEKEFTAHAAFISLQNSFLLLVTDQPEFGIGTVTLSAPPSGVMTKATSSPFNIFGMKNTMLSGLIGKTTSKMLKKPILSLILIKEAGLKQDLVIRTAMGAVTQAIEDMKKNHPDLITQ